MADTLKSKATDSVIAAKREGYFNNVDMCEALREMANNLSGNDADELHYIADALELLIHTAERYFSDNTLQQDEETIRSRARECYLALNAITKRQAND